MTAQGIARIVRQTIRCANLRGARVALAFLAANLKRKAGRRDAPPRWFQARGVEHPVLLRGGRGDFFFFAQIFVDQEFGPLRAMDISTVVDLGGNIGLASIWFLNAFPHCRVLTIEANPRNHESLEENLRPYGNRSTVVKGGVWWRRAQLSLIPGQNEGDAHVVEASGAKLSGAEVRDDDQVIIDGWDIASLMQAAQFSSIDLLKVDIEGAEVELFQNHADRWLPMVKNISVETHGAGCESAILEALRGFHFRRVPCGELTFFLDLRPASDVRVEPVRPEPARI